jgi:hypothetical protein
MKIEITKKQALYLLEAVDVCCSEGFVPDKEQAQIISSLQNIYKAYDDDIFYSNSTTSTGIAKEAK